MGIDTLSFPLGVNAIRILQELGMLDEIVESVKPELPVPRAVLFRSGIGDHKILFDVRYKKRFKLPIMTHTIISTYSTRMTRD